MTCSSSPPGSSKPRIGPAAITNRYYILRLLYSPRLYCLERQQFSRLCGCQLGAPGSRGRSRGAGGRRKVSPAGHRKRPAPRLHGVGRRRWGVEHATGGTGLEHGRACALSAPRLLHRGPSPRLLLSSGRRRCAAAGAIGFCEHNRVHPPSIILQGFGRIHGA